VVANDEIYKDVMRKTLMEMTTPPAIKVYVWEIKKAAQEIEGKELQGKKIILLFNKPADVLRFLNYKSNSFEKLNIGPLGYEEGKEEIFPGVFLSQEERNIFFKLEEKGLKLEIQITPGEKKVDLIKLLKSVKSE
jgi:PTS system mannose-specific IIB component